MSTESIETQSFQPGGILPSSDDSLGGDPNPCSSEVQDLKARLEEANSRLRLLSEGMRLLASQIRQADLTSHPTNKMVVMNDDHTVATECDTVISEEDSSTVHTQRTAPRTSVTSSCVDPTNIRLNEITDNLTQSQTADLLALQNAVYMLEEHARLSSQEAVTAVHDVVAAQSITDEWKRRAKRAEQLCTTLEVDNARLEAQNQNLSSERRILIKEVRKLRKMQSEKRGHWKYFESYVMGAMNMHEQALKKNQKDSSVVDDGSAFSTISDDDTPAVSFKTDKPIRAVDTRTAQTSRKDKSCRTPKIENRSAPSTPERKFKVGRPVNSKHAWQSQSQQRSQTTSRSGAPPERIHVYPEDCVSPVMSYDSVDGVWALDSNDKLSVGSSSDFHVGKEHSGCDSCYSESSS